MIRFYLDKKSKNECEVFLDLSNQGRRIRMFTGKKISPDQWDADRCRANHRKYKNNVVGFNRYLQDIEDQVICLKNESKPIGKEQIKDIIDRLQGKRTSTSFYSFATDFLNTQLTKKAIRSSTFRNHEVTLNYLKNHFPTLDFKDADLDFYDRFVSFLRLKELATNTIGRHIKSLKWFLRAGFDRGLHTNMSYRKSTFKTIKEESDAVYVSTDELSKLQCADLPGHLRRIADAFVINCNLGLRYNDQIHIQKSNLRLDGDDKYLVYVQGKTNALISVPIPDQALRLLEKYNLTCPLIRNGRLMSGQKFNAYIKEACEQAKIETPVTIRSCGKTLQGPKYRYVKSHTARRSFATNLYDQGVSPRSIMAVTGHKKEQTFLLYVKSGQFAQAKSLAKFYKERSEKEAPKVEEPSISERLTA